MFYDRPEKRPAAPRKGHAKPAARGKAPVRRLAGGKKPRRPVKKPPTRTPARRQTPKRRYPLLRLIALLLVLCLLAAGGLYVAPLSLLGSHDEAAVSAQKLPGGYTNILLVGADINNIGTSRSDSMIIVSVGHGTVKLTSLMRDTGVTIPGYNGTRRVNAAYSYGGIELLLKTVNENFGLDITRYAVTDYDSFVRIVDALGGLDIDGVTDAEVPEFNKIIGTWYYSQYTGGKTGYDEAYSLYERDMLDGSGSVHMNGAQALTYARIRKNDSDYNRTSRQRRVLKSAMRACTNPLRLIRMLSVLPSCVDTNLNLAEIIALGERCLAALSHGEPEQLRLPVSGSYTDSGGMFQNVNYNQNHRAFTDFLNGGE